VNDKRLLGSVQSVFPTISEGIMTLIIGLESPSHALLRSNLRVDVRIITQEKVKTLRLKRGPAIRGPGEQTVFVVRGDCALRWKVRVGISSFDQFEIVSGLSEGDIVIISDMTDYMHLEEVQID
jgi:HlyD family secretion protein